MLNTVKLGLISISVCNSVFNVNRRDNQFLYRVDNELNVNSTCKVSLDCDVIIFIVPGADGSAEKAEIIKKKLRVML